MRLTTLLSFAAIFAPSPSLADAPASPLTEQQVRALTSPPSAITTDLCDAFFKPLALRTYHPGSLVEYRPEQLFKDNIYRVDKRCWSLPSGWYNTYRATRHLYLAQRKLSLRKIDQALSWVISGQGFAAKAIGSGNGDSEKLSSSIYENFQFFEKELRTLSSLYKRERDKCSQIISILQRMRGRGATPPPIPRSTVEQCKEAGISL